MQPAPISAAQPPLHTAVGERTSGAGADKRPLLAFNAKGCTHSLKLRDSLKLSPQLQLELGADLIFPTSAKSSSSTGGGGSTGSGGNASSGGGSSGAGGVESTARVTNANDAPLADAHTAAAVASSGGLRFAGPWVALQWQVDPADRSKGLLRADAHHVSYSRCFTLGRKGDWWALPLDAKLGLTYTGQPHVAVGTSNVPLVLGLAAALLVAGKPVHLAHKEVGGLAVHFPLSFGGTRHRECLQERVEVDLTLQRQGRGLRCDLHQLNGVLRLREE